MEEFQVAIGKQMMEILLLPPKIAKGFIQKKVEFEASFND